MKKYFVIFLALAYVSVASSQDGIMKHYPKSIKGSEFSSASIPYHKIHTQDQDEGDVLFFSVNAGAVGSWISYPLTGLNYLGDWDVSNSKPEILPGGVYVNESEERLFANVGDYFIVTSAGTKTFDILGHIDWGIGDWIIFNGENWQQIKIQEQ